MNISNPVGDGSYKKSYPQAGDSGLWITRRSVDNSLVLWTAGYEAVDDELLDDVVEELVGAAAGFVAELSDFFSDEVDSAGFDSGAVVLGLPDSDAVLPLRESVR